MTNPSPVGAAFIVTSPSSRHATCLAGASYTFENGQSLAGELLHDGHGLSRKEEQRYFSRADSVSSQYLAAPNSSVAPLLLRSLGQGISQAPLLLNRDYLYLLWQSNPQDTGQYWRVMWTRNGQDASHQLSLYGEKSLSSRLTLFALMSRNFGKPDTEFGSLMRSSLMVGIKVFVP
jgi:hypothetical protein